MRSSSREEIIEVFDALAADAKRVLDVSFEALTIPERLALLQLCEKLRRQLPAVEHPVINQISRQADAAELGGTLPAALANRLLSAEPRPPAAFRRPPSWANGRQ